MRQSQGEPGSQGFGAQVFSGQAWARRALVVAGLAALSFVQIFAHPRAAKPQASHQVAFQAGLSGTGAVEVHYAPAADLERVDLALLRQATRSIDIAAYLFVDQTLIEALADAAKRGVRVRLYLDGAQEASREGFGGRARGLRGIDKIELRLKPPGTEIMHLKSYVVDGKVLRTGSANFTYAGLKREDDDLVVIRDPAAIEAFAESFEAMWRRAGNMSEALDASRF
ncbi:MAG: phosphatidylserine synthase [Hyphomicrobiales bacterium]|nr:phosphatidylserine synthase [Hyphomicrobiales bacterium]